MTVECGLNSDCRVWTETAKSKERICGEKSVVNFVNGFVILVLICVCVCFQPVICTKSRRPSQSLYSVFSSAPFATVSH